MHILVLVSLFERLFQLSAPLLGQQRQLRLRERTAHEEEEEESYSSTTESMDS